MNMLRGELRCVECATNDDTFGANGSLTSTTDMRFVEVDAA